MKRLLFAFLLCGVFESCFCQDVKGFVMQQYEEWFSSKDSILSSGYYETDYLIKDLTLNKSKQEFFESIQSIDVVLDCPSQATVQINLDNGILFIETLFHINNCESDEDCCQCEDTTIDEHLRHLNNRDEGIKWHYNLGRIFDSDGQSIDYDQDEFYNQHSQPLNPYPAPSVRIILQAGWQLRELQFSAVLSLKFFRKNFSVKQEEVQ